MNKELTSDRSSNGQFAPGASGNPAGRPRGSRNRSTILIESLLDEASERLTSKAIELAIKGDPHALKLCFERLLPPRKDRPIDLQLPEIESVEQLSAATSLVIQAVGNGQITPVEGQALTSMLVTQCNVVSTRDLYQRFEALEKAIPTEKADRAREAIEQRAVDCKASLPAIGIRNSLRCGGSLADRRAKAAGPDRRPVFFTVVPDYEGINAKRNRDWKSTFDRR